MRAPPCWTGPSRTALPAHSRLWHRPGQRGRAKASGWEPEGENAQTRVARISDLSSAPQNRHLAGQRGHLRAHGLDVRLVVQALRVVGHAVAQLEQTVREALKDRIALAGCSHGLHQGGCGEEGTAVSSAWVPPAAPRAVRSVPQPAGFAPRVVLGLGCARVKGE